MKYTAAHWGAYRFNEGSGVLEALPTDPEPSRVGRGWVSASKNTNARILKPAIRKGWLEGDNGRNRCNDAFVEVDWDRALELAATELDRVRTEYGNQAIYGGSYGWSSTGRFHHAQSQMRRFLSLSGGFTSSRETYSHAAAEVLFPHVLGMKNKVFQDQMTTLPLVAEHCQIVLAFGGLNRRTAQIASSGTSTHDVGPWVRDMRAKGVRVISIAPEKPENAQEWWAIRPGTDTALILALIFEVIAQNGQDDAFLSNCTSGWPTLRKYITGESDGVAKSAEWAAPICDVDAGQIRALATDLIGSRSLVSMAWGMQRADHGEQPIWAGLALASVLGQIGQPGTGFAFGYGSTTPVGRASRSMPWPSFPVPKNPVSDFIPVARVSDMLLQPGQNYRYNGQIRQYPDIQLVWWTGGNPYHHHQDLARLEQAWTRPNTVIVNEQSWTATARRADIVFPATTPLERADIMMNRRDTALIYMSPMMPPIGQSRDDFAIFSDLAARTGCHAEFTEGLDADGWLKRLWSSSQQVAKENGFELPDFEEFKECGLVTMPQAVEQRVALKAFVQNPDAAPLGTESGKITLTNNTIAQMQLATCPGHPTWLPSRERHVLDKDEFHLISGQPDTRLHSQNDMGDEAQSSKRHDREVCTLHPATAKAYDLSEGDVIKLYNKRGACLAAVGINADMRQDCVSLPTGAWFDPQTVDGEWMDVHGNPNALTLDIGCSELSQGNMAHTCVVRIEKWLAPLPPLTVNHPPPFA